MKKSKQPKYIIDQINPFHKHHRSLPAMFSSNEQKTKTNNEAKNKDENIKKQAKSI